LQKPMVLFRRFIFGLATLSLVYSGLELARYIHIYIQATNQPFPSLFHIEFIWVIFGPAVFLGQSVYHKLFHRSR